MYGNENINIKRGTGLGKVANNSCLGSFGGGPLSRPRINKDVAQSSLQQGH